MPLSRPFRRLAPVAALIGLALACNDSPTGPVAPAPDGAMLLSDTLFTRGAVLRAVVSAPEGFVVVPSSVTWTLAGGEAAIANLGGDDDSVDVALTAAGPLRVRASYTVRSIGAGSSLSSSLPTRRPSGDVGVVTERALTVALPTLDYTATPAATNTAGAPLAEVRVAITDARGRVIPTATDSVTIAIDSTSGASGATLLGTSRVRPVAGIATFTGLSIRKAGTNYRLVASSPSLTARDTTLTTIVAGAPDPAQSSVVMADTLLGEGQTTTVTVTLRDQYGNLVTNATGSSFTPSASGGSFSAFTCVNGACTGTYTAPTTPGSATVGVAIGGTTVGGGTPTRVTVVDRTPPVITGPSGAAGAASSAASIPENTTAVHTFTANETSTWRISGGSDAAKFVIDSVTGALRFVAAPDFEAPTDSDGNNTYVVTVEARDAAGNVSTQTITVTVTNVAEGPSITGPSGGAGSAASAVSIPENTTAVHTFTANGTVTWSLDGGTDAAKFTIDATSGALAFATAPDFEAPTDADANNTYIVIVKAKDSSNNSSTQTVTVTVTDVESEGGGNNTLEVGPAIAEKLPNGTQQFTVTGGTGPYTWKVNGVAGGNATFGTITADGLFTAPPTVPSPGTYEVCVTDANGETGCATVTISDVPSAGGDLIVINDINWGSVQTNTGFEGYPTFKYPGNKVFVQNLVNYPTSGSRKAGTKVWFFNEGGNAGKDWMPTTGFGKVAEVITGEGFAVESKNAHADLETIPADVKVIFLVMPGTAFAKAEFNALKQFALQGGRIIYVGENGGYYAYGLALQVTFITTMGGKMTNTGGCDAQGVIVTPEAHQLSTGIGADAATGFFMNCVSPLNLGPNDYAIFRDPVKQTVMVGAAKIDFTPIP